MAAFDEKWQRSQKPKEERFIKPFVFPAVDSLVTIHQRPVEIDNVETLGYTVWDASLVIGKYFEKKSNFPQSFWADKRVLTLGSGTGVDTIVLSLLGAEVIATDLDVSLLSRNIAVNLDPSHKTRAEVLRWGNEEDIAKFSNEHFDFIVACDCIYYPDLIPLFLHTLSCLSTPSTTIIIGGENHYVKVLEKFLEQAEKLFKIEKKGTEVMDEGYKGSDFFIWHLSKL